MVVDEHLLSRKQTISHYISWNILFLWGLGLWIALCASNMYYPEILNHQATLFYVQNLNLVSTYNISMKTEAVEDMLQIANRNCILCNVLVMLKFLLRYVHIFLSIAFAALFLCSHEYFNKTLKLWNNVENGINFCTDPIFSKNNTRKFHFKCKLNLRRLCKLHSMVPCVTPLTETQRKGVLNRFIIIQNKQDCSDESKEPFLEANLIMNREVTVNYVERKITSVNKGDEDILYEKENINASSVGTNIVQAEVTFNAHTFLLFNNCELYQYFNNRRLKSALFSEYSLTDIISKYVNGSGKCKSRKTNSQSEQIVKKGIISSSPEFQEFLANLRKSYFVCPYMLQVSPSYVVCIKSIYQ